MKLRENVYFIIMGRFMAFSISEIIFSVLDVGKSGKTTFLLE